MTPAAIFASRTIMAALTILGSIWAPTHAQTPDAVERLAARIEAQQREIEALRAELVALKTRQQQSSAGAAAPSSGSGGAPAAPPAALQEAGSFRPPVAEGLVIYSREGGAVVTLTGQINQAVNLVDDGNDADAYFVDNEVSSTRFAIEAVAPVGETRLGALLEIGVSPNDSYEVSQTSETADDTFTVRRADLSIRHDRWGRISLGRGSMALDDVAEYDLSLVATSIMYSGVADPVGGILFTDRDGLTDVTVGDAFFNFDGDRRSRIRYDTPLFGPVQASAAFGSDGAWDIATTIGGDYGDWSGVAFGPVSVLAAIGLGDPAEEGVALRYSGSLSLLHENGLGLTLSAGSEDRDDSDTPYSLYGKLSYDAAILEIGPTGFGVDVNYVANGAESGDDGVSFGVAGLQRIDAANLDIYGQVRWFSLDRPGRGFNDIVAVTFGGRFAF